MSSRKNLYFLRNVTVGSRSSSDACGERMPSGLPGARALHFVGSQVRVNRCVNQFKRWEAHGKATTRKLSVGRWWCPRAWWPRRGRRRSHHRGAKTQEGSRKSIHVTIVLWGQTRHEWRVGVTVRVVLGEVPRVGTWQMYCSTVKGMGWQTCASTCLGDVLLFR
jgi:hypothetical protein